MDSPNGSTRRPAAQDEAVLAARAAAETAQELADFIFGLLNAASKRGSGTTAERFKLIQDVCLGLTSRVAERTRNIGGKKQASAFSAAMMQAVYHGSNNNTKGIGK